MGLYRAISVSVCLPACVLDFAKGIADITATTITTTIGVDVEKKAIYSRSIYAATVLPKKQKEKPLTMTQ